MLRGDEYEKILLQINGNYHSRYYAAPDLFRSIWGRKQLNFTRKFA
jgi:hypothetical protein